MKFGEIKARSTTATSALRNTSATSALQTVADRDLEGMGAPMWINLVKLPGRETGQKQGNLGKNDQDDGTNE
jgi:hypothetical protein